MSINHCTNLYTHCPKQNEVRVRTANFRTNPNFVNSQSNIFRFPYESFSFSLCFSNRIQANLKIAFVTNFKSEFILG